MKKRNMCVVAIYGDRNVIKKEAEKILKYEYLIIEIQRKWNVKAEVISVITGATRTISKSLKQYLSNMLGQHEIKELQKKKTTIGLLGTANVLRKFLMYRVIEKDGRDLKPL